MLRHAGIRSVYASLQFAGRITLESEGEIVASQAWNERIPGDPLRFRDEVDLAFRIDDQSIEIFEIRALWRHPGEKVESSVAKATYVKSREAWKVYWKRADGRWHRYEPAGELGSLEEVLALVGEDAYGAFWG